LAEHDHPKIIPSPLRAKIIRKIAEISDPIHVPQLTLFSYTRLYNIH
jgi:hypothetical protein